MHVVSNIIRRISFWGTWVGMSVLLIMMLLVICNIITRLFGSVIVYTLELVEIMSVVAVSFCIVYATLEKSHVVVDIVLSHIPQKLKRVLDPLALFLGLGTWVIIAIASVLFTKQQWMLNEITELLDIPLTPFRVIWILAIINICIILLIRFSKSFHKVVKK